MENQDKIKISVVIPLYNKKYSILNTIQSVLKQDYQHFEMIIINDGSTDGSETILSEIQDYRIHIIHKVNSGVSDTRNLGLQKAKGEYVAFLDADDIWDNYYLQRVYDMIHAAPDCGMYAQNFRVIPYYKYASKNPQNLKHHQEEVYQNWEAVFFSKTFRTSAIAVNKKKFLECGGFDASLTVGEDLEAWLRISLKYPVCYLDEDHVNIIYYQKDYHSRIVPKNYREHYTYKLVTQTSLYLGIKNNLDVKRLINKAVFYAYLNFSWDHNREASLYLKKHFRYTLLSKKDKIKFILFQMGCLKYMVKR